ncbi:MAG: metal ABC transporter ATP-binding protein [Kineosporiaceae bacterium]
MTAVAADTPVIRLQRAEIGYGERPTVRGVDLDVRPHEVLALVGANGSGKSTLVKGILGLATVMAGSVELFGVPRAELRHRWRLGYVPQRHSVGGAVPSTVEEVVTSGRLPRKRWGARLNRADREAVAGAIETVGLADRRRATVATLSGGQQRRVLIARALASQPEVLIMDEPTAGVDHAQQERLTATLQRLVAEGLTLVVVTHELQALAPVLTRVVTVEAGRLVADVPASGAGGLSVPGDCAHLPDHPGNPGTPTPLATPWPPLQEGRR